MGDAKRSHVRIAAAILAAVLVAAAVFTYLSYTAAFTPTDTVTVTAPRAGLVMEPDAKVKFRGIQIGKVEDIEYDGDQAKLTLAIDSSQLPLRPVQCEGAHRAAPRSSAPSRSSSLPPDSPRQRTATRRASAGRGRAARGQHVVRNAVRHLHKIDPIDLNATLTALGEGLRGNGDNLGATLSGPE